MLKGNLILLRAMEPSDIDELYHWENNTENWIISNTTIPFSKHFLKNFILNASNDITIDKQVRLMIVEVSTNQAIGTLDVFEYDPIHRRAGLGILIDDTKRNKGYASEALQLVKEYSFSKLQLHQLFCNIMEENERSKHLFLRHDFEITGIKKEWILINNKWHDVLFLQLLNNSKS